MDNNKTPLGKYRNKNTHKGIESRYGQLQNGGKTRMKGHNIQSIKPTDN